MHLRMLVLGGCLLAQGIGTAQGIENKALLKAIESIRAEDLKRHVYVLADDSFEGREAGSRGGRAAAVYLCEQLEKWGLKPAGTEGSWFQSFAGNHRNVLGVLKGSDPNLKHEYILVGAHYDHVGYGTWRNSNGPTGYIHNGADDNASGTSAVLEVAEAFAALDNAPRRSIVFAFWDGEEKGLLGSEHFASTPNSVLPLKEIALSINLDMIGRLREHRLEVSGTRTGYGLRRRISEAADGTELSLDFTWEYKNNSDHWSFYQRGIPSLLLHTGLHDDYHRPSDDAEKLNEEGMEQISRLLFRFVRSLANAEQVGDFRQAGRQETATMRYRLEQPLPPLPARLGLSWAAEPPTPARGLPISQITPGSPAEKAGVRVGDRALALAGTPVASGDDLRRAVLAAPVRTSLLVERPGQLAPVQLAVELLGPPVRIGMSWRADDAEPDSVLVTRVVPDSPAAIAGVQLGDRIYQLAGRDFQSNQFGNLLAAQQPDPISLQIERNGQLHTVNLAPLPVSVP